MLTLVRLTKGLSLQQAKRFASPASFTQALHTSSPVFKDFSDDKKNPFDRDEYDPSDGLYFTRNENMTEEELDEEYDQQLKQARKKKKTKAKPYELPWDEEKYGPEDSEDWVGFKGDMDEVDEKGNPLWLQSMRKQFKIMEDYELKQRLARQAYYESKKVIRVRQVDELGRAYGTGRRKTSSARVWLSKVEEGQEARFSVNNKDMVDYFARDVNRHEILRPFLVLENLGQFNVKCTVTGGGPSGQAGAIRHGLSRALQNFEPEFRVPLKRAGFITRDPRMVERKKPGQPKARKKKQWVKR